MIDYKQYDPKWASYPYAGETIQAAGCGPTAVADIIEAADPKSTASWMQAHGYASNGHGTIWGGIPACLQAYGIGASQLNYSSLYGVKSSAVFDTFRTHIQSGKAGVLLMGPGYWTSGGHYICVCGYKDGKYLVYDPASSLRTGWHAWADFSGQIKICFTAQKSWGYSYSFTVPALEYGKVSRAVTLFERLLAPRGIYKGPSDQSYGEGCVAACKTVQALNNLPQNGKCQLAEWVWIIGTEHDGATFHLQEVRYGSTGSSVIFVQLITKAFGFYTGAIDGIAGYGTRSAVIKFQEHMRLNPDGIAGPKTLAAMVGF